ncbi:MAG: hypothetical protein RBT65_15665 [Methanolobus sp.]|nr:hypothetical protein [Methanolobus sp.]
MTLKQLQAFEDFVEDYLVHIMDRDGSFKMLWKYSEEKFIQEIGVELAKFNMTALEVMSCLGAAFDRYKRRSQ